MPKPLKNKANAFGIENAGLPVIVRSSGKRGFVKKGLVMEVEKKTVAPKSRREFMKTTAQVAVAAPAVAVLLQASTKPAVAAPDYDPTNGTGVADKNSFGIDN